MAELVSIKRNVDVSPGQAAPAVFHCSQGDVGSKIILGLVNNGTAYAIPSGVTVTIEGSESNGSIFTPISATASGSDITFYLTGEMTAVAGPAICQAVLKSGSNILGTANFTLEVESSPMGADAPPVFTDAGWTWMLNKLTTEFVPALGDNIIDAIESKLDKNQGTANAGKYLKVGANGNVETADLDKTLSIADKAADAKAVGDELDDLKAELTQSVDDLKSAMDDIVIWSSNRLNFNAITPNKYIAPDGTETSSAANSITDFIPVVPEETIYFWSRRSDGVYYFDARFVCAYDANKAPISSSGGSFVSGDHYVVPTGIYYIRLTISNTYLSNYTNFYVGSHSTSKEYEPYGKVKSLVNQPQVDENTVNIVTNAHNILEVADEIENITEPSSNLINLNAITQNVYIPNDGSVNPITSLSATDYIPVTAGESIYAWGMSDGAYSLIPFRFVCAYDVNKNAVEASGYNSETAPPYVVPNGIAYLRLTLRNASLELSNLYIGTHSVGVDYEPYGRVVKLPDSGDSTHSISSGQSLLEAVKYCYTNNIKNLIVEAGTYDVIKEYKDYYGDSYFDDYIDYAQGDLFDAGIWLQNINVKFSVGAKVVCKYTGSNQNVIDYFSAFATGNNVTLDGLVLDAENLRYGIHADYNSGSDETFFIVKNCDLKNVRSDGNKCIGAGLGKHVYWLFENTIFRTTGNYYALRIHNNVNSDAQSKIVVKDCYIDGDGFFVFNAYSTSTLQTIIQVCGCSYKTVPVVGKETQDSNDNFTMLAWNNEIRQ